eukprot:gnl/TRDRNA2_/TRDRNA2_179020_c0_seq1.p1 gnl/TRDRNA2_/TRDRNA2_179020_c0~~gnl/TRDRNA2_/TRDRNA2_179020_c0_seq1.p1  ORF type:complete len:248 (+),score=61.27 gnl/TRDRNA2_/TRDRNA2_179020_c0_seq1:91-834(+)
MQATLLQETMPRTSYWKTQMFVSLLIGFGVGMVVMRPMHFAAQEATDEMALGAMGRSIGARPGLMQPLTAYNLRGIHNTVDRSVYQGRRSAYARAVMVYASEKEEAVKRLQDALKVAEDCVGECSVEWDNVEELSAAVSDSSAPAPMTTLSAEDKKTIEDTKAKLGLMQKETAAMKEIDEATLKRLKQLESVQAGMKEVTKKVSSEKSKELDDALAAALEAAKGCTDDCAVAWEEVEELSAAKADQK